MGTRHLVAVYENYECKIAQYGQWDGYPSGQGIDALKFCRENLLENENLQKFKSQLNKVRFVTSEEYAKLWEEIGININANNGYVTFAESEFFHTKYPYFSRDNGADILRMVFKSSDDENEILMKNSINFAADSIFCEWAYVIDLDKMTFEVFKGFNTLTLDKTNPKERFAYLVPDRENGYKPIKFLNEFSIYNLPSNEVFLELLDPPLSEE